MMNKGKMTVYDEPVISAFDRVCERVPNKPAIIYLGEHFSYAKMKDLIDRFATALYEFGVRCGDKFMIYIPNCPQWVIAYYGCQRIGAIPVPISPIYTPFEIEYLLNDCGAESILCQDMNFGYVKEVMPKTALKRIVVTNYVDLIPIWKKAVGWLLDKIPDGRVEWGERVYPFKDMVHKYPSEPPNVDFNPREHLSYILYTGGTTGFPKGCPTTHSGMVSQVVDIREVIEGHVSDGNDVLVFSAPLFHQFGQAMFMGTALTKGNPTVLMPMPEIDSILAFIERYRGTLFLGVPALYRMILENDRLDQFDLTSLRYCWSGGDVLPVEVYNRWKKRVGIPIWQGYGATEVGFISLDPLDREPQPGIVGRPLPTRKTMVVDSETLDPLPPNETGELLATSEFMADGYLNKPEETAASYVAMEGKTWYKTNDYVQMTEAGLIRYVDRSSDVIKYKGYRISCSEIEAVLQDHAAVIGSCVVGVPDHKVGERIKAMVVLKEDARGVSGGELIRWCRDRLAPYKIPKYVEFRDMLPKTKVGKLLRREVREQERRRVEKKKTAAE
jgi:long-chain acyl-CoA synthetase